MKWSGTAGNSQVAEGQQQSNVPTVTNGQPASNASIPSVQPDRQTNGSRFNPEKNRELQKLPLLKGDYSCAVHHGPQKGATLDRFMYSPGVDLFFLISLEHSVENIAMT